MVLAYWCVWGVYFKVTGVFKRHDSPTAVFIAGGQRVRKITGLKYTLAVLPAALFLLDSLCLQNYPLAICAVIFGIAHIGVTRENIRKMSCGCED